jgi:hypothetical protein
VSSGSTRILLADRQLTADGILIVLAGPFEFEMRPLPGEHKWLAARLPRGILEKALEC